MTKSLVPVQPGNIACDTTNAPTDNVRVRQALDIAIQHDALANGILKGEFSPAPTILPPDIPGYNPDAALAEDPDQARQLLADAGYPDGQGFPEITFTYTATSTQEKKSAEYLQGIWKQTLGINVKLETPAANAHGHFVWHSPPPARPDRHLRAVRRPL